MNEIRITVEELVQNKRQEEGEYKTVFRLLAQKGMPSDGVLNPTPAVRYEYNKDVQSWDLVFRW